VGLSLKPLKKSFNLIFYGRANGGCFYFISIVSISLKKLQGVGCANNSYIFKLIDKLFISIANIKQGIINISFFLQGKDLKYEAVFLGVVVFGLLKWIIF